MLQSKRVLVAPMDWGLGHATRCIPLINALLKEGNEVIIASSGPALILLQKEFPDLQTISFPAYNIRYYFENMALNMMLQGHKIIYAILLEYLNLSKAIENYNIDIVISDNRFGCFNKQVKSIFITHQLYIRLPGRIKFLEPLIKWGNHFFIRKFNECWIPDFEEEAQSLAGQLAHPAPNFSHKYIGSLSRMTYGVVSFKREILVVLSGPEPQRTHFEKKLITVLKKQERKILLVQGKPDSEMQYKGSPYFECKNFMDSKELNQAILESEIVICRAGYTSIMDLTILGKKALLIPTPGQTEQEYLAEYFDQKGLFASLKQKDIQERKILQKVAYLKGLPSSHFYRKANLEKVIKKL